MSLPHKLVFEIFFHYSENWYGGWVENEKNPHPNCFRKLGCLPYQSVQNDHQNYSPNRSQPVQQGNAQNQDGLSQCYYLIQGHPRLTYLFELIIHKRRILKESTCKRAVLPQLPLKKLSLKWQNISRPAWSTCRL